jgi:Sulfotransferase family
MIGVPNLFVVGAAKSGTTALYHYFAAHPQIYVPPHIKEPNYMAYFEGLPDYKGPGDKTHAAGRSITSLPAYLALYAARTNQQYAADLSPVYLRHPKAPHKILELSPDAKIVMVLRNPIEGTLSMFSMMHRDGREPCASFSEAFRRTPQRLAAGWEWAWDYQGCFMYSKQVSRYLEMFPRENLFIRRYDQMKFEPERFYRELTAFLDIPTIDIKANRWVNRSARRADILRRTLVGKAVVELARAARLTLPAVWHARLKLTAIEEPAFRLSHDEQQMLADHFGSDIEKLAEILGWDLSDWLRGDGTSSVSAAPRRLAA